MTRGLDSKMNRIMINRNTIKDKVHMESVTLSTTSDISEKGTSKRGFSRVCREKNYFISCIPLFTTLYEEGDVL